MTDLVGKDIGRYHIIEQLGQGGMATVYRAYDNNLERDVAFKVIRTGVIGPDMLGQMLKRFEREAKSLAKLEHANIVSIYDYGNFEGSPYLVMQFLSGGTLKKYIQKPMPHHEAARLILPVARALEYAHRRDIVHRDVKPANILITEDGESMLSDFGIAKILQAEKGSTLTGTGVGIGTPEYMAPEQWTGEAVPQTDIYALGVVFYELITGKKPFTADTPAAVLLKQINDPLPRPTIFNPDLPDEVERVIFKALAKAPEERYTNMEAFAQSLEKLLFLPDMEQQETMIRPVTEQQKKIEPPPTAESKVVAETKSKPKIAPVTAGAIGATLMLIIALAIIFGLNPSLFSKTPTDNTTPPLPTSVSGYQFGDILFEDSFDQSQLQSKWFIESKTAWGTKEVDGRTVAYSEEASDEWNGIRIRDESWKDYAIQFDFKFEQGDTNFNEYYLWISQQITDCPPTIQSGQNYSTLISPQMIKLSLQHCEISGDISLDEAPLDLNPETWHTVVIVNIGTLHETFIDGEKVISQTETEYNLDGGGLWIESENGVLFVIDNVVVYEVLPAEEGQIPVAITNVETNSSETITNTNLQNQVTWELLAGPSETVILYVNPKTSDDGNGTPASPYNSIEEAWKASSSGGTLALASGTYRENISLTGKEIYILGGYDPQTWQRTGLPEDTVIDGDNKERVFHITNGAQVGLDNLTIKKGSASCENNGGGGLHINGSNTQVEIQRSWITNNRSVAPCGGGGIEINEDAEARIVNSIIYRNIAPDSAGIGVLQGGHLEMINVNIVSNTQNGLLVYQNGSANIANSLFWNNADDYDNVYHNDAISYFGILIDIDPDFVNLYEDNLHLKSGSPAINKGNTDYLLPIDMEGNPRPIGSKPDIGAYEYVE